jgi:hypothetical protein
MYDKDSMKLEAKRDASKVCFISTAFGLTSYASGNSEYSVDL